MEVFATDGGKSFEQGGGALGLNRIMMIMQLMMMGIGIMAMW